MQKCPRIPVTCAHLQSTPLRRFGGLTIEILYAEKKARISVRSLHMLSALSQVRRIPAI